MEGVSVCLCVGEDHGYEVRQWWGKVSVVGVAVLAWQKKSILSRGMGTGLGGKAVRGLWGVLVVGKERSGKGVGFQESTLGIPQWLFLLPLCFYLDLFVGQLKSCLKCQACGYRSTTFEVFCDLSLPIPKVGFQKIPGVDGTWVLWCNPPTPSVGGNPVGLWSRNEAWIICEELEK